MELQATIHDTNKYSAYGYVRKNDFYLYGEKRTNYWKFFFQVDPRTKWYDFEVVFNEAMSKFIRKYRPNEIRINTKFKIKPVKLCNMFNMYFEIDKNKIYLKPKEK